MGNGKYGFHASRFSIYTLMKSDIVLCSRVKYDGVLLCVTQDYGYVASVDLSLNERLLRYRISIELSTAVSVTRKSKVVLGTLMLGDVVTIRREI